MAIDYQGFEKYYINSFPTHLNEFCNSYFRVTNDSRIFAGFGIDHLTKMDTIYMRQHRNKLTLPSEVDVGYFFSAIWITVASDLLVYNMFPEMIGKWHCLTQYPKITGWNYCAAHPVEFCDIFLDSFNSEVKKELYDFFNTEEQTVFNTLINDICSMLGVNERDEYSKMYNFLLELSFSQNTSRAYKNTVFSEGCFRDSEKFFDI